MSTQRQRCERTFERSATLPLDGPPAADCGSSAPAKSTFAFTTPKTEAAVAQLQASLAASVVAAPPVAIVDPLPEPPTTQVPMGAVATQAQEVASVPAEQEVPGSASAPVWPPVAPGAVPSAAVAAAGPLPSAATGASASQPSFAPAFTLPLARPVAAAAAAPVGAPIQFIAGGQLHSLVLQQGTLPGQAERYMTVPDTAAVHVASAHPSSALVPIPETVRAPPMAAVAPTSSHVPAFVAASTGGNNGRSAHVPGPGPHSGAAAAVGGPSSYASSALPPPPDVVGVGTQRGRHLSPPREWADSDAPRSRPGPWSAGGSERARSRDSDRRRNNPRDRRRDDRGDRSSERLRDPRAGEMCRFFNSRGGCRNGDKCPWMHVRKQRD